MRNLFISGISESIVIRPINDQLRWVLTLQLLINLRVYKLLLALWASNKYLAGPKGHHKISSWPKGPAKDLEQPEAAHDLLWPEATTS